MYAIILAGGIGTRLWPRSRENRPKQFSDITGSGLTMIQETAQRLEGVVAGADLCVVCLLYTSDPADEKDMGDFRGRRYIKTRE